jgi:hypothetical protein
VKKKKSKKSPQKPAPNDGPSLAALRFYSRFVTEIADAINKRRKEWQETGSFGPRMSIRSVAAAMGVSPGTVLNNIAALENYFEKPVVDMGTMVLTPFGIMVARFAVNIVRMYELGLKNLVTEFPLLEDDPPASSASAQAPTDGPA